MEKRLWAINIFLWLAGDTGIPEGENTRLGRCSLAKINRYARACAGCLIDVRHDETAVARDVSADTERCILERRHRHLSE